MLQAPKVVLIVPSVANIRIRDWQTKDPCEPKPMQGAKLRCTNLIGQCLLNLY